MEVDDSDMSVEQAKPYLDTLRSYVASVGASTPALDACRKFFRVPQQNEGWYCLSILMLFISCYHWYCRREKR